MNPDVYHFGMIVDSTILRLVGKFPALDTYGEIAGSWNVPGGEAFNAAVVLSRLGLSVKLAGPHLGRVSKPLIERYAQNYGIDMSELKDDPNWPGVRDVVLVDDDHRTVLGWFGAYFSDTVRRWSNPNPESIRAAKIVCIDPWFPESSQLAANLCVEFGVPYVTIDCAFDSELARHAAAIVVSGEYRRSTYPDTDESELLARYVAASDALVVFSAGSNPIRFARKNAPVQDVQPYRVDAVSTLGAGDVFRAGIAYGLLKQFDDVETVRTASALAALCCTRMPIADTAPTLEELRSFRQSRTDRTENQ